MALAKTTQDHDEIRKWAEARGGKPAVVAATEGKDETGIIRLMFPDAPNHNDGALEEIGWDEWFEKFDESGLELTYQEKTAAGKTSDFNKLTYPDPASAKGKALLKKSAAKKGTKSAAAKPAAAQPPADKLPAKPPAEPAAKKSIRAKVASKPAAKTSTPKPAPAKTPAKKPAVKKSATKTATTKTATKKSATKSASQKSSPATPARNYPKPDANSPTQIF